MYKPLKKEIVSVLVVNQANVLTRVVSMFGRRGFNIDSLTVSATKKSVFVVNVAAPVIVPPVLGSAAAAVLWAVVIASFSEVICCCME